MVTRKNCQFWLKLGVSGLWLQFESTDDYVMLYIAWSRIEEVPYCFSRSSVKCQDNLGQKSTILTKIGRSQTGTPVWIQVAMEWCTKLEVAEVSYYFSRSSAKLQDRMKHNFVDFEPNWAFLDCNFRLSWSMAMKWYTQLEIA